MLRSSLEHPKQTYESIPKGDRPAGRPSQPLPRSLPRRLITRRPSRGLSRAAMRAGAGTGPSDSLSGQRVEGVPQRGSGSDPEFGKDSVQVSGDGPVGQEQALSYLLVAES